MQQGLSTLRVIDFSYGIAGGYCTKLLSDAGADVVKVEPPEGDPWRTWSASGASPHRVEGGALFRFLHHGKRSVIGGPTDRHVHDLVCSADLVVEGFPAAVFDALDLPARFPSLVWLSVTPYGRRGPLSDAPTTEFIVQAESGGLIGRGTRHQAPIMAGGRITEWVAGTFASVAATAAARYAQRSGHGEHIDFSIAETMTIAGGNYAEYNYALAGRPPITVPSRTFETPSIEPTLDGYVGVCTNSRQQFDDFLILIERPDLLGDDELARSVVRQQRWDEWNEIVHAWTRRHTTAEIVRRASDLRIPVAPVHNGRDILEFEQFVARGVYVEDPTGTFLMPTRPWRLDDEAPDPPRPAPRLGEHTGRVETREPERSAAVDERRLPLDGVRILDLTAWWAGPVAAAMLAALGADVIHVESITRPDGMRMTGAALGTAGSWWERSTHYLCANTNKRNLTLDLSDPRGRQILQTLIATSDVLLENYSPRVLANFGLSWDAVRRLNERCILVRMPAFGLTGPWRDNTGFAQTMEQVTGLAWLTGHTYDQPRIQRGPSDPNAGMHAAFAILVALAERDATGRGSHVEVSMVEGALNAAAEAVLEYTAYGALLERNGNRSPNVAPQGLYACEGFDCWLAISIETDDQWVALRRVLGEPESLCAPELATHDGRLACHDMLDAHLAAFCASRDARELAERLVAQGVPAAFGRDPRFAAASPQLIARRFYEVVDHPVVGAQATPTVPFRFASVDHWICTPAPLLGQHNHEILSELAGLSDAEITSLEDDGIIGTRPTGV